MRILFIRHAQAVDDAGVLGDAGRWLTPKGRRMARKVGRWLGKRDKRRPDAIWTSPLVRAAQTAEILAAALDHDDEVRACAELAPGQDPAEFLRRLTTEPPVGVLALIGHEPSLSLLATALVGEDVHELKKCGVLGVRWKDGAGKAWLTLDPATLKAKKHPDASPEAAPPETADEID
jgi:phosphohistidine phosphatase